MDLHGDDAGLFNRVVRFGIVDRLLAVDPQLNPFAFAQNAIVVPVVALQNFEYLVGLGATRILLRRDSSYSVPE